MMMVMWLGIERAALAAPDNHAMGIMMGHIDKQCRLATTAAIGLVPPTLTQRLAGRVFEDFMAGGLVRRDQDHIELRHERSLFRSSEGQLPTLSTHDFSLPARPALMYRCAP